MSHLKRKLPGIVESFMTNATISLLQRSLSVDDSVPGSKRNIKINRWIRRYMPSTAHVQFARHEEVLYGCSHFFITHCSNRIFTQT